MATVELITVSTESANGALRKNLGSSTGSRPGRSGCSRRTYPASRWSRRADRLDEGEQDEHRDRGHDGGSVK
jgi:hypothetical protein